MIRTIAVAAGVVGIGLLAAAPASADEGPTSTVSCSPPARCIIKQTVKNYSSLPGLYVSGIRDVPSQAIDNYRNFGPTVAGNWNRFLHGDFS